MSDASNPSDDLFALRRQARLNQLRLKVATQNEALSALRRSGHADRRNALEGYYDPANYFDPRDYLFEAPRFGGAIPTTRNDRDEGRNYPIFRTEQELSLIRGAARWLTASNPVAVGVLTSLTNYVIGNGFQYAAIARNAAAGPLVATANVAIDEFLDENDWSGNLDRELFQRSRIDGEYFLGLWHVGKGHVQARTIEPDQVTEPSNKSGLEEWLDCRRRSGLWPDGNAVSSGQRPDLRDDTFASNWGFGVHTHEDDPQSIHGYYVQWSNRDTDWDYFAGGNEPIVPPDGAAMWMEHAKLNVVRGVKRGLSDFYPIDGNLDLARRVLRNMGEGSAVQAAIAWIQEVAPGTTQVQVHSGTLSRADGSYTSLSQPGANRTHPVQHYDPATILKVPNGQKYLPGPLGTQHAPNFITAAEALLRTVALRWNLPENLITGSAANNNFASSLVAETPFVKYAESQQQFYAQRDRKTLWRVLRFAWQAGRFGDVPWTALRQAIEITVTPPQVEVRDPEKETRVRQILHAAGVLSKKTWSAQESLDFDQEQKNLRQEEAEEKPIDGGRGPERASRDNPNALAESLEDWDASKHPRGGNPRNPGQFSDSPGNRASGTLPQRPAYADPAQVSDAAIPNKIPTVANFQAAEFQKSAEAQPRASYANPAGGSGASNAPGANASPNVDMPADKTPPKRTPDHSQPKQPATQKEKLDRTKLLSYFKLLYGDKGQKLLRAFEKAGGVINPKDVWFAKSRLNVRVAFGPLEIGIDDSLNPAEAAQELMERLLEASGLTEVRQHLSHSGFKNIESLIDSYRQSIKQATEKVALAAELYLSGISVVNEGADWVLTIHELSEGNYQAAIAFLPFIPAAVGKTGIVLKHGSQTIRISGEAIRKIKALPVKELIELLESTRNLARNMAKSGLVRPANTAAHHIVPQTLKKFKDAVAARAILTKFGIGIENAANGVYLPSKFDDAVVAAYHGSVHTEAYYTEVLKRLRKARSKEDALVILDTIRSELLSGKFPH